MKAFTSSSTRDEEALGSALPLNTTRDEGALALLGAPNSGKTTLFNWLTGFGKAGLMARPVNYPGSTVEFISAPLQVKNTLSKILVLDTPGLYSLHSKSKEARDIFNILHSDQNKIQSLVVVMDATQLERQLYLLSEVCEMQRATSSISGSRRSIDPQASLSIVAALSMTDLLQQQNLQIDLQQLQQHYGVPFVLVDGLLGGGVVELVEKIQQTSALKNSQKPTPSLAKIKAWSPEKQQQVRQQNAKIAAACLKSNRDPTVLRKTTQVHHLSDKLDACLLHPYWGPLIFIAVMMNVFAAVFWVATPFMEGVDHLFGSLASWVPVVLGPGLAASFLADGVMAGFGAVLVFVPQIFILFFALRLLEASGYLARAALIIDKPLTRLGLSGRTFVPLLSGFACAVPAVMAARQITSPREKWLTVFIIPLMSCSARLPVYTLLLSFLFVGQSAWKPALALMLIYVVSALVGAMASYALHKIIKRETQAFFSLDLPLYRRPRLGEALQMAWLRSQSYIKKAGPIIFVLSVLIWALMTYPNYNETNEGQRLATSYAGQIGVTMEPVFKPMGLDWRVGVGLISAFAAREVFVASLAVVLGLSSDAESQSLLAKMQTARTATGEPLFNWANLLALIVFFMIALQCVSTTGVVVREMGSMKMAVVQFISMNLVAYVLACLIYQGLAA